MGMWGSVGGGVEKYWWRCEKVSWGVRKVKGDVGKV